MTDRLELAERVEKATEASRELDMAVARTQGWSHFFVQKDMWWKSPAGSSHGDPPRYTASLDAAMSLAPQGRAQLVLEQAIERCVLAVSHRSGDFVRRLPCFVTAVALRASHSQSR